MEKTRLMVDLPFCTWRLTTLSRVILLWGFVGRFIFFLSSLSFFSIWFTNKLFDPWERSWASRAFLRIGLHCVFQDVSTSWTWKSRLPSPLHLTDLPSPVSSQWDHFHSFSLVAKICFYSNRWFSFRLINTRHQYLFRPTKLVWGSY